MTRLKIKGIYFENIDENFNKMIVEGKNELDVSWEKYNEVVENNIDEITESYEKSVIDAYVNLNTFTIDKFLEMSYKNQAIIVKEHADLFKYFIMYINYCHVLFEKCRTSIGRKRISQSLKCSIALYGIITRRAKQINEMLMNGYSDGAMIVWRSLYENVIAAATILIENNDELARKFKAHSLRNSKKKIESFSKNYQELKLKALSKKNLDRLKNQEQLVTEKYGKEFIDQEFGWADDLFPGKKKANLRELEIRLDMTTFRPYYLICSEHIHLGFNAFNNFSSSGKINLAELNSQETDFSNFIDPMQFTTAILHQISNLLLHEVSVESEYQVNSDFLKALHYKLLDNIKKGNSDRTKRKL